MTYKIDPEFLSLQDRLTEQEYEELERRILEDGEVLNPVIVWQEEKIILDGMHRFKIATTNNLPYPVKELSFPSRIHARRWTDLYAGVQMAKSRALNVAASATRIQRIVDAERELLEQSRASNSSTEPVGRVRDAVAAKLGVSPRKVQEDMKAAKDLAKLAPAVRAAVQDKKIKVSKKTLSDLAEMTPNEQVEVVKAVEKGKAKTPKEAIESKRLDTLAETPVAKVLAWNAAIDEFCKAVEAAHKLIPKGEWISEALAGVMAANKKAYIQTVKKQKLTEDCPQCEGDGCPKCFGMGQVTEGMARSNAG